jgi:hypothetical protein
MKDERIQDKFDHVWTSLLDARKRVVDLEIKLDKMQGLYNLCDHKDIHYNCLTLEYRCEKCQKHLSVGDISKKEAEKL